MASTNGATDGVAKNTAAERLAYTVREAAAALGVGRDAVYNAINRGELRAVRFGGTTLVPRVELERLLGIERAREPVAVAEVLQELAQILADRQPQPAPLAR